MGEPAGRQVVIKRAKRIVNHQDPIRVEMTV